jgi:hypothetical protein
MIIYNKKLTFVVVGLVTIKVTKGRGIRARGKETLQMTVRSSKINSIKKVF